MVSWIRRIWTPDERLREEQLAPLMLPPVFLDRSDHVERPRLSHHAAAVRVVVGFALAGAVVGALWAWVAPPIQIVIALTKSGDRVRGYLGDQSDLVFLNAFLMTGLLTALAVIVATGVWQWRAHRGPILMVGLTIGALAAAGAAIGVGAALAHWRTVGVDIATAPISPEHRVFYAREAPAVFFGHGSWQVAALIVVPAGVAALVYATCALTTRRDDLGAWPPIEMAYLAPPMRSTDPVRTVTDGPAVDPSSPLR